MKILLAAVLAVLVAPVLQAAKTLDVYTIDVEGGKSVLIVSPAGKSMLIDAGWPAAPNHTASMDRIVEAVKDGLTKIDYVLISHFDIDHIGDLPQLTAKVPIGQIFDHGQLIPISRKSSHSPFWQIETESSEVCRRGAETLEMNFPGRRNEPGLI